MVFFPLWFVCIIFQSMFDRFLVFNQNVEICHNFVPIYNSLISLCSICLLFTFTHIRYVYRLVSITCVFLSVCARVCVQGVCVCKANPSSMWLHSCSRQTTSSIHTKIQAPVSNDQKMDCVCSGFVKFVCLKEKAVAEVINGEKKVWHCFWKNKQRD